MRKLAVLLLLVAVAVSAEPPKSSKPAPKAAPKATHAPDAVPHTIALFLASLSKDGASEVTFKAQAHGMRFFFEEPGGVTVYRWENGGYKKEEYLRNSTLAKAVKRYEMKAASAQ